MRVGLRYAGQGRFLVARERDRKEVEGKIEVGSTVFVDLDRGRSGAQERWWFAVIDEVWANLPHDLEAAFPSPKHLRSFALIKAGWCDMRAIHASSPKEARTIAAAMKWADPFTLVMIEGLIVLVYKAKSQARTEMGGQEFSEIADKALMALSNLIGTDVETLTRIGKEKAG